MADWNNAKRSIMWFVILVVSSIPPNFCQLALASTSYVGDSVTSPIRRGSLTSQIKSGNIRGTRSRTIYTKHTPSTKFNASAMESEIAAIFKEFAYGSSIQSSTSSSTTSSTTTSKPRNDVKTSTYRNYFRSEVPEPKVFIGKQREVHEKISVNSDKSLYTVSDKVSSTSDYSVLDNNSGFTYFVNFENKTKKIKTENFSNDKPIPVLEKHPSFDIDEDNVKEIQVRVTSIIKKRGYEAIQQEIGRAWVFHVYLTGISFGIVAVACLLSLSRISTCSQLLPRGYFITLHLMLFLASFLRCLLFLHDPYGAYDRLPTVLTSLLFNTVDPCLTTAYSIVLLVLLRAGRIRLVPLNMQSPLVLATLCGIHIGGSVVIDVSSGVLEDPYVISTLNITTQAITATWGAMLCLGYVISFNSIERAAHRQQGDLVRLTFSRKSADENSLKKNSPKPSLIYAARLFLICTLLHGLLIAFIILNLVTTKVPIAATSSEAWAWWTQTSLERIVEIALCVLLLATALVLTQSKPRNAQKEKEEKIFSILPNCARGTKGIKNVGVYPVANEKCNILGNGTLRHSSLNSSMNPSKGGWKHISDTNVDPHTVKNQMSISTIDEEYGKTALQDCNYNPSILFSTLQIVSDSSTMQSPANIQTDIYYGNFIKEANQKCLKEYPHYYSHLNNCSKTLPGNNYYCSQRSQTHRNSKQDNEKSSTVHGNHQTKLKHEQPQFAILNPSNIPKTYTSSPSRYNKPEHEYEIAPYYTHSSASSSSHVYTKPYSYFPAMTSQRTNSQKGFCVPYKCKSYNRSYEIEPRSEISVYSSSQSEIHVDYLTDASSSNDGLSNTLSRSLTLPLYSHHCPMAIRDKENGDFLPQDINLDHTPDSAVGLDYSSQVEGDLNTPENYNCGNNTVTNSHNPPINFLRLSTTSLNEVIKKNPSAFLGKFVSGGNNGLNYSPLNLDDSISSPSSECPGMKKSISTGDLTGSINEPSNPNGSPANTNTRHFQNTDYPRTHVVDSNVFRSKVMNAQPVTCI